MCEVDLKFHDIARIRLLDATKVEIDAVQQQTGLARSDVAGEADIVIRFADACGLPLNEMRILGDWEFGFSHEAFWILPDTHGQKIGARLPLDTAGKSCEIVCCRPVHAVPLLGSILNLTALAKGFLPLHASAFLFNGESVLVTGWSQGGKTESLLAFAEQGATYLGDEWVYLDAAGDSMFGLPQRIHLWDWHLDSQCHRGRLSTFQRFKLAALRPLNYLQQPFVGRRGPIAKIFRTAAQAAQQRRHVRMTPQQLFGGRIQTVAACPERVFFVGSHAASTVDVRPISMEEIVARMAVSLEHEFEPLIAAYRHFRFAFPGRTNPLLERLPELLRQRLAKSFQHKHGLAVWHPYPVPTRDLFDAMSPYVGAGPSSGQLSESSRDLCDSATESETFDCGEDAVTFPAR